MWLIWSEVPPFCSSLVSLFSSHLTWGPPLNCKVLFDTTLWPLPHPHHASNVTDINETLLSSLSHGFYFYFHLIYFFPLFLSATCRGCVGLTIAPRFNSKIIVPPSLFNIKIPQPTTHYKCRNLLTLALPLWPWTAAPFTLNSQYLRSSHEYAHSEQSRDSKSWWSSWYWAYMLLLLLLLMNITLSCMLKVMSNLISFYVVCHMEITWFLFSF